MPIIVKHSLTIEGGSLKTPWVPADVITVNNRDFICISKMDRQLAAFCGVPRASSHPLKNHGWLDWLTAARNIATAKATADAEIVNLAGGMKKRTILEMQELPIDRIVYVDCEGFVNDTGCEVKGVEIAVLSELNKGKCVFAEATSANLTYIREAVFANRVQPTHAPRARACERTVLGDHVYMHRHGVPFVKYTDGDGRQHRKFAKLNDARDGQREALDSVVQELIQFRAENHHDVNVDLGSGATAAAIADASSDVD